MIGTYYDGTTTESNYGQCGKPYSIKVLLGSEGSDYVLLMDEDDGDCEYQYCNWTTTGSGGIPSNLAKQINNCSAKKRYITDVAFGPNDEWFVTGKKRDGSGEYSWWGGTSAPLEPCGGAHRVQAASCLR
jgi:hypothetical protein